MSEPYRATTPVRSRPLRIAVGGLAFEGNSLSPVIADEDTFRRILLVEGEQLIEELADKDTEMSGALFTLGLCDGVEIIPLIDAEGGAGGRVEAATYRRLRARLLNRLHDSLPIDGLYLRLHGAFLAEGEIDAEGELLEQVRALIGPEPPVAVSLDLHGNITPKMAANASFMIGFRHYPHDDCFDTGRRTAGLLVQSLAGRISPVMRVRRVPMLAACQNQRTKGDTPLAALHARARAREAMGEILAASYFPVQHGLDLPGLSFAIVVIANADSEAADRVALELARDAWDRRHSFDVATIGPAAAIAEGLASNASPIVLSEASDNVGGGAFGDSAIVLRALLENAGGTSACITIVDPAVVKQACAAGIGAQLRAAIGNKHSKCYGEPLEVEAEVVGLFDGRFVYSTGCYDGIEGHMGPTAVLEVKGVNIVVASYPTYEQAGEQFVAAGIDPWQYKFVVVKNPMNFQKAFEKAPVHYHLDTSGPTTCRINEAQWKHLDRPIYPLDDGFEPVFEGF